MTGPQRGRDGRSAPVRVGRAPIAAAAPEAAGASTAAGSHDHAGRLGSPDLDVYRLGSPDSDSWLGSDSDVRLGGLVQAADGLDVTRISDSDLNSDARLEFPTRMPDSDVTRMFDSDA